jgi:hypothetical protein
MMVALAQLLNEVLAEAEQVVFQLEVAKSIPAAEVVEEHFKVQEVVEDQALLFYPYPLLDIQVQFQVLQ